MKKIFQTKRESGNATFLTIFLLLPVILGFFGLAVDTSRGVYAAQSVPNNVESAIVGSASQILPNGRINIDAARAIAVDLYTKNRVNTKGNVRCAKLSDLKAGESLQGGSCPWILSSFRISANGQTIIMKVREYSPNAFLNTVGVKEFSLIGESSAKITYN